MINNNNKNQT